MARPNGARSETVTQAPNSESVSDTPTSIVSSAGSEKEQLAPNDSTADSAAGNIRRLSRAAPGQFGTGNDYALAYALSEQEKAQSPAAVAADRLRQSMQQDHADRDRELGLNVPAPLIMALETAARDVAIPTNATALFTANIDGSGHLLGLEFAGSNQASPQWNKLSERVEQALRGRKLLISKNTKGGDLKLRLVARSQLPSGRDPGTAVNLLGVPVKKGQGKHSSKISILDPTPELLELEIAHDEQGRATVKVPVPGLVFSLVKVVADPSDIGAPARQMIRVQVLDEKVY